MCCLTSIYFYYFRAVIFVLGIDGTFDCDPEIPLASHDHDSFCTPYIFREFSIDSGNIARTLDFGFEKEWRVKDKIDRSLRKELVVIYSMVVLELTFATMESSSV